MMGAPREVQAPAPETDSMVGVPERGIRAHVTEMGVYSYSFLRMGDVSLQEPTSRQGSRQGSRYCTNSPFNVNSLPV